MSNSYLCANRVYNDHRTMKTGLFKMYQTLWIFFPIAVPAAQNSTCAHICGHITAHSHAMLGNHQLISIIYISNEITGLLC